MASQSNEDVPTPPGSGAFRVKRVEARPRPVVGPDGRFFYFPDVLGDFFKAHPNMGFYRGVGSFISKGYRHNYADALNDLLQ
jgi:hypothetical protein